MNPESQQQQKKMGRPRKFSDEFRVQALERMKRCENVTALARELGIRREFCITGGTRRWAEVRNRDQALKGALQRVEELRRKREQTSGAAFTNKSGK